MTNIETIKALIDETMMLRGRHERGYSAVTKEVALGIYERLARFRQYLLREDGSSDMELFRAVQQIVEDDCEYFLLERIFELAHCGLVDEAVNVGRWFSEVSSYPENFLRDVGCVLAEAGRAEEALEQVRENLRRFPDDVWVVINAGDALFSLGDTEGAEGYFLKGLQMATGAYDRLGALERLIDLSLIKGDTSKADEYEKEFRALSESDWSLPEDVSEPPPYGPVVKGKKIGRNEPCPCGSGKKYKKCCGT